MKKLATLTFVIFVLSSTLIATDNSLSGFDFQDEIGGPLAKSILSVAFEDGETYRFKGRYYRFDLFDFSTTKKKKVKSAIMRSGTSLSKIDIEGDMVGSQVYQILNGNQEYFTGVFLVVLPNSIRGGSPEDTGLIESLREYISENETY